jgi:hypothetical protein
MCDGVPDDEFEDDLDGEGEFPGPNWTDEAPDEDPEYPEDF